jgi:Protein of unknown function (DUF4231)
VHEDLDERRALALERCDAQVRWYTKYGIWAGVLYRLFQTSAVVLAAITPVLILWTNLSVVLQALPAALASVAAALAGIYGWQENKARFSYTAEALKSERIKYETRTGLYRGDPARALGRFVTRIEAIAMNETSEWRNAFVEAGSVAAEAGEEPEQL